MRIESPLFVLTNLSRTEQSLNKAVERLSSGSRINHASDDPAGLSMATGLDSQIRGLTQGIRNLNDVQSFLNIADGALGAQTEIVQRMREITVEATNGTLASNDRANLNLEFQQLFAEFQRLASQTNFNGQNLLDGSLSTMTVQAGDSSSEQMGVQFQSSNQSDDFTQLVGTGAVTTQTLSSGGNHNDAVTTADVNGDGYLDLVSAGFGGVTVAINQKNGSFSTPTRISTIFSQDSKVADVNGDGNVDILADDVTNGQLDVFLGNGDGTFKSATTFAAGAKATGVGIGDFNGDGKLDVAVNNVASQTVSILLGNGNGTFQTAVTYAIGNTTTTPGAGQRVTVTDLNGDGKLDILTPDWSDNTISILYGNGDGTFKARVTLPTGSNPDTVKTVDMNNDGILDLVVTSEINGIEYYQGNGDGTFKTRVNTVLNNYPTSLSIGDYNKDGNLDVVTTEYQGNDIVLLEGNGNGTFKVVQRYAVGTSPFDAEFADLNNDGVLDMVSADDTSSTMTVFLSAPQSASAVWAANISTQAKAQYFLPILDNALNNLNLRRANPGAYQTRLQSAVDFNTITVQNLSDAKSKITDTDYASELPELVKAQILQQAGVSALAQANMDNRLILQLFNF